MYVMSGPLKAAFTAGTVQLCHIWKITRKDGTVFRFTDLDEDVVISGDGTYKASDSFNISTVSTSAGRGASSADLVVALTEDSGSISKDDIEIGLFDDAAIEISRIPWALQPNAVVTNGALGKRVIITGTIGDHGTNDLNEGTFTIMGLLQQGIIGIGEPYGPECPAMLGDARCTVNLASFTQTGTVTTVASRRKFRATIAGTNQVDNYFQWGILTWTSGDNSGAKIEVLSQLEFDADEDDFILALNMGRPIQIGDTFSVIAGCDKRISTCHTKFNNVINYRGYPAVPGEDFPRDNATGVLT